MPTADDDDLLTQLPTDTDTSDLAYRLRKRAQIRRPIPSRKAVQERKPDRMADLLDEAADEIERLRISPSSRSQLR